MKIHENLDVQSISVNGNTLVEQRTSLGREDAEKIVQYTGGTTEQYKKGHFYMWDGESWKEISFGSANVPEPIVVEIITSGTLFSQEINHNRGTSYGNGYGYPCVKIVNMSSHREEFFDITYVSEDSLTITGSCETDTTYKIIVQ